MVGGELRGQKPPGMKPEGCVEEKTGGPPESGATYAITERYPTSRKPHKLLKISGRNQVMRLIEPCCARPRCAGSTLKPKNAEFDIERVPTVKIA